MSMPSIPDLNPQIQVDRTDVVNIILSSIGMEELSLAHIVNAEAEKIQFALGTLSTAKEAATLSDIMEVNNSAKRMLRDVIKNQMLISMKMEDTVDLAMKEDAKVEPQPEPQPEPQRNSAKVDDTPQDDPATADDPAQA